MGEGVYTAHVNANVLLMSETFGGGGGGGRCSGSSDLEDFRSRSHKAPRVDRS